MTQNISDDSLISTIPSRKSLRILGICLGASTVSMVQIEVGQSVNPGKQILEPAESSPQIIEHALHPHEGNPKKTLLKALKKINLDAIDRIVATGRQFRKFVKLSSISESEAVEHAYRFVKPSGISCPAIVSAGGETFLAYILNTHGQISNVLTGNKCASGTGEFFLQQLRRMDVSIQDAAKWAATEEPHPVSGRCSVFCKSDCTHATNKGVPKSKVTAGLCKMMAHKILELLKTVPKEFIMITGGTAKNRMMVEYLRQNISNLIIPKEAPFFEALGAALWACEHETLPLSGLTDLFRDELATYDTLAPLARFEKMVQFKTIQMGVARAGDACILGLDVGSTTTKAILLRKEDNAILSSVYLRTHGNPVQASRKCYRHILNDLQNNLDPDDIHIEGLGVCGSGRQIAGLHALTDGVVNEIIAHAAAAVHFDPKVDTLFEIGGQDAKYTLITNGVPSDYAMNEACSAGTGSFLEESAYETLRIEMEDIADIALKGQRPPNFNDQCAAFIASDIKNAIHEGGKQEDIVAGLVYSICMNYAHRVKGNRPVGEKVFMQGGVCYNRAVPLAMAALVGKPIIVPPEPGLMGALGVALVIKEKINTGLMQKKSFNLKSLADREVIYRNPFTCKGGKEKCDRKCEIAVVQLEEKKYTFGGACNRYYNLRNSIKFDIQNLDLIRIRQHLIFEKYAAHPTRKPGWVKKGKIGFNRSFLVNSYYPLYSTFFAELGFESVLPQTPSQKGIDLKEAAFCYPVELAHGFFYSLISSNDVPDYLFLPHFRAVPNLDDHDSSQVCPLIQGETYYLQTTYKDRLDTLKQRGVSLLTPILDLTGGLEDARSPLIQTARQMGMRRKDAEKAFETARMRQLACFEEMKTLGKAALKTLSKDFEKSGVVIFSRPYNGFVDEAHMGIPHKLASRGIMVIPFDFLSFEDRKSKRHMYWGMGQQILKAGRMVKQHPQLFGTYITNFSCGPDSFLIGYFRDIMGRKPSLTLELDNHTADAGLETRIEAFLDIVTAYRQLPAQNRIPHSQKLFTLSKTVLNNGAPEVITSDGQTLSMTDPRVTILFPSMGNLASESITAIFQGSGYHAKVHPPSDEEILKLGRANSSCKECLPLILTTGTLLNYIQNKREPGEVLVYFMPTGSGPCRFGQYYIFMEDLIRRLKIHDVALFSLNSDNGYMGLSNGFHKKSWWGIIVSDVMEDIRSMLLANASDPQKGMAIFEKEWQNILVALKTGEFSALASQITDTADQLQKIPLKKAVQEVPTIALVGEIFVRRDQLSRQFLTEKLAKKGFATICSPIAEWMWYSDYTALTGLTHYSPNLKEKMGFMLKKFYMGRYEKRLKTLMTKSGLVHAEPVDIKRVIKNARPYIAPELTGEAILTVGSALTEIVSTVCGVIAIGPFGCMPNRLSEAILSKTMTGQTKLATDPTNPYLKAVLSDIQDLPFLAIESDGSPFPQLINAKVESFCLRAKRLHEKMLSESGRK